MAGERRGIACTAVQSGPREVVPYCRRDGVDDMLAYPGKPAPGGKAGGSVVVREALAAYVHLPSPR